MHMSQKIRVPKEASSSMFLRKIVKTNTNCTYIKKRNLVGVGVNLNRQYFIFRNLLRTQSDA